MAWAVATNEDLRVESAETGSGSLALTKMRRWSCCAVCIEVGQSATNSKDWPRTLQNCFRYSAIFACSNPRLESGYIQDGHQDLGQA